MCSCPAGERQFGVDQVVRLMRPSRSGGLCCGSGAISAALLVQVLVSELYAADIDPVAVRCACRNIGDRGTVCQGDLYVALPAEVAGRVDLVVCNAPRVPTEAIAFAPAEARLHEPRWPSTAARTVSMSSAG